MAHEKGTEPKEAEIKFVNQKGEFVQEGSLDAAYRVNMNDPDALNRIEGYKKAYEVANPTAREVKAAETFTAADVRESIEGIAPAIIEARTAPVKEVSIGTSGTKAKS